MMVNEQAPTAGRAIPTASGGLDLTRFYDDKAAVYHDDSCAPGEREERILAMFPPGEGLRVLDVGCGAGRFLRILRDRGHQAVGVEISPSAVEAARATGVDARVANAETGEGLDELWECGRFDAITLLDVLEHTFDPSAVLRSLVPLLEPGGAILISVPNVGNIGSRVTVALGRFPSEPSGIWDSGHIRWFTHKNLRQYLERAGRLEPVAWSGTTIPLGRAGRLPVLWRLNRTSERLLSRLAARWPGLWGYQLLVRLAIRP
jgi:methionine biosynthesis protein MetW